jgi:NADH-quinone oxidoreductase subunit M
MIPFHAWLPEAHVEAPTVGSVILAALLLKLGGYGFIRVSVSMFPLEIIEYFIPFVYTLALMSI